MEFKVIAPGADEIQLFDSLAPEFKGIKLPDAKHIIAEAHFGKLIFQHYKGDGFDIWYSNYFVRHDTQLIGRADIPILELHIQFLNQFQNDWDGFSKNLLRQYQYNISYSPFVNNTVKFIGGKNYHTFDIHFSTSYLERISIASPPLSILLEKVARREPGSISAIDRFLTPEMIAIVNRILQCSFTNGLNKFYIESKVLELLTMILDHVSGDHPLLPLKLSDYDIEMLYKAKDILLSDKVENLSISTLSKKVALNEYKLKRGFKYLFGETVFGYRHLARMEKARQSLLDTNESIDHIAYDAGFEHSSNFNKAFKKLFKFTPSEYRKLTTRQTR